MIKKHLLGGALLASVLFLFTGCKEIMSHLDNSVDSHLQVADKVTVIGVGDTYTITKDVDYATISDAAPKFESQTPAIATVDPQTGAVKALKSGDARIKISLPDNGLYLDASAVIDIKVIVRNTDEFYTSVNAFADGDYIFLAEGASITMDKNIDLKGKAYIVGDKNKPAKITLSKSIVIYDNFTLKNVKIDASGVNDKAVFLMSSSPTLTQNSKSCYEVEEVNFEGVTVTGIQQRFFYDNKKAYVVKNFKVNNCVIGLATVATESDIEGAIEFNAGGILEFDIENSTVYQTSNLNVKYFTKYNNSKVPDNAIADYTACNFWTYKNNTFYKVAKEQWHNGGRIAQKASTMTIDIENNIWVDCATNGGGILRRMFGGNKKSTDFKKATISLNTYWLNGAAEDNSGYDKTESPTPLTTDPDFVNAPTNLKPQGADQVANKTGDPRWLK